MKIGFDVSDLATNRADGTTRYTRELVKRLPALAPHDIWQLYSPRDFTESISSNTEKIISPWPKYWTQSRFAWDVLKHKPDILFMPIQQLPILRSKTMKTVAVIHDLAFHRFSQQTGYKDWLLLHAFTAQVAREADRIIAVSQATADDIAHYYGRTKHVHVVHHGVDHDKFRVLSEQEKQTGWQKLTTAYPILRPNYILYVGQIQPRKNLVRLIEAFELLRAKQPDLQLVIAGGHGWKQQSILAKIKNSSAKDGILLTGPVADELLPALYAHAEVFTLVSLYEGFGMPILEAMACGIPVVTSNVSSMPEIAGEAAVLVDPHSSEAIAAGIATALSDTTLGHKGIERAKHFTWEKTAQQTFDVLKS